MLPIPATFVVGRDGLIRARFIDPDYRKRMMIADMIAAMRDWFFDLTRIAAHICGNY
jgi:hypothetical protein